jgi:nucleotide-binding universal stress UspA family protein
MYKTILLPLAHAPGHHPKREFAAARAVAAPGAHVILLHVLGPVPEFSTAHLPESAQAALPDVIADDLTRQAEALMDAEVQVLRGDPAQEILNLVAARGVDCIVMAPHRSDDSRLGSTTDRVIRDAPCTVHLVR